jgi:hypothetical protein
LVVVNDLSNVVGFGLPLFYWGFLHQCLLRRLSYSSPFWRCLWFWNECNTGFIEWVRQYSFLSISWKSLRKVGISSSLRSDRIQQRIHQILDFSFFGDFLSLLQFHFILWIYLGG